MKTIGIIGTGVMGRTVASKVMAGGYRVVGFDNNSTSSAKALSDGVQMVQNPAEVARRVNMVLLFLPGPDQVTDCVAAEGGLLSALEPGSVIADMSTVDPKTTARMAGMASDKRIGYLDAPILGRPATVGKWAIAVGGREEDLESCRPVFELVAARIFYIGPAGSGHKVKLLNQMMFGAINAMTAEMMAVASTIGIPPRMLYETITGSQAGTISNLFVELGGRIAKEDYEDATFTVDLLVKDLKLAVKMAEENHSPPILGKAIELINEIAQTQGFGAYDTSIMWKSYSKIWNIKPE
jgi:3-hydroxyisobutyrate dehydrogenase-like beta-hydroxyacid dehydrogenase